MQGEFYQVLNKQYTLKKLFMKLRYMLSDRMRRSKLLWLTNNGLYLAKLWVINKEIGIRNWVINNSNTFSAKSLYEALSDTLRPPSTLSASIQTDFP